MPKAMVITVGTGRSGDDIAKALSLSIQREHPDYILFLVSPLSERRTLPLIDANVTENRQKDIDILESTDDVEDIYLHYVKLIRGVIDAGFRNEDIVVDYTSGTKPMSAALFAAGIALEVGSINYTAGRRDDTGRVIPGMERPVPIKPLTIFAENKIKEAKALFNRYQFQAAMMLLESVTIAIQEPSITHRVDCLKKINEAYWFWDTFNLNGALNSFGKIKSEGLMSDNPAKEIFEKNFVLLSQSNAKKYSLHRLADLFHNIKRRMQEAKYDDAQARIYRLFEYMAQVKLYQWNKKKIETLKFNLKVLPENLRRKYKQHADDNSDIQKISMVNAFALLADLNDALGKDFMHEYKKESGVFRRLLNKRNNSILAHGFTAIARKDCEQLLETAEGFLNRYFPEWSKQQDGAIFPRL